MVNIKLSDQQRYYAWKFINFMQQYAEEYLEIRIIQPSKALMESELYLSLPYAQVFKSDMERANVVYHAQHSSKLQDLIRTAVESVMLDGVSPERAYATLKAHAQELLDGK
jgi:multiple sugar transport system substrate-binding protein